MPDIDTSPAALRALRTLAQAATRGPWCVSTTQHPFSLVRCDGSTLTGEHVERHIVTVLNHPQSRAPDPIVTISVGVGLGDGPPVSMVYIRPEDADYLAAVSPEVVLGLLDTLATVRARLLEAEDTIAGLEHRLREALFAPAGDNHHNAWACQHCNPFRMTPDALTKSRDAAIARAEKAEAERDALAGRRPEVLLHWDSDGDFSWGATDGLDVVCVDERCPNDRVYETTGALSVEVIQRVADGRAQHPIDALDQIAREATTPEDPVHD